MRKFAVAITVFMAFVVGVSEAECLLDSHEISNASIEDLEKTIEVVEKEIENRKASETSDRDEIAEDKPSKSFEAMTVVWDGCYLHTHDNETYLVCQLTWTNTTDQPDSFMFVSNFDAYQNGVELEESYVSRSLGIEEDNVLTKVLPGHSTNVYKIFKIRDMSAVECHISPCALYKEKYEKNWVINIDLE